MCCKCKKQCTASSPYTLKKETARTKPKAVHKPHYKAKQTIATALKKNSGSQEAQQRYAGCFLRCVNILRKALITPSSIVIVTKKQ